MALLVCSILLGLQALPGIFKPYSKGVGMMLTKPPADQKGKDMLMIFHHFLSFGRLMNAVTFITAAFVCPCKPLIWFFLLFGLAYTCLALYEVKAGPRADRFSVTPKFLNAMIALFGIMYGVYLLAILIPSSEFDEFIAEMESSPTSPLSVGRPALVWVLIGYSVFQILLQLPPLIAPAMGLEGYFGDSYRKADRYLKGQLEGYIKLMSCQFLSVQIATAGLLFMTPSLYPVVVVYCFLNAYGIVLFSHNVASMRVVNLYAQ
jgi:hypothetical protein